MMQLSRRTHTGALTKRDGRTRASRLMRGVRSDLTAHVGGKPSAPQKMLIERAAALALQVALLDEKLATCAALGSDDARRHLATSAALARLLRQLGPHGTAAPPGRESPEIRAPW